MAILVTGGAGYIGTHTCVSLLDAGYDIVVLDNFCRSSRLSLDRVKKLTKKDFPIEEIDLCHEEHVQQVFQKYDIEGVIHFAGLKAAGESIQKPLNYYDNNITGTMNLLKAMDEYNVKQFVFSSSATVYGEQEQMPLLEDMPLAPINPYGQTKAMIEQILRDYHYANPETSIVLLRYFNPVGAHESGDLGEDPNGEPNNLLPRITQFAVGRIDSLTIFGEDYPTPDGSCIRDYIHVMDLAEGHVQALAYCQTHTGVEAINLGTGKGNSVLEVIQTFMRVNQLQLSFDIGPRREGDAPISYASTQKASKLLSWQAKRTLDQMCLDAWRWQQKNPQGFEA